MNKNDFTVPAGDFLVMVSRWAYNTNITNAKWIEKIWAADPHMSAYLSSSYRTRLKDYSNLDERPPYGALMEFISNLDDSNRVSFAKAIYDYAMREFAYEFA